MEDKNNISNIYAELSKEEIFVFNVSFMRKCYRFENFLIFIISVLLYVINSLIFSNINSTTLHYFFTSYFNDLLAPLLLFSYINLLLSLREKKIYSLKYLIIIILFSSFVWEYLVLFLNLKVFQTL